MQNKANLPKTNVTIVLVRDYENEYNWTLGEIRPNLCHRYQTQSCPPANPPVLQHFVDFQRVFVIFLRIKTADNLTKNTLRSKKWNMQLAKQAE
jgi:hypothetical protein